MNLRENFLALVLVSMVSFSAADAFAMGGKKTDVPGYAAKINFSEDVPEAQEIQIKKDLVALSGITFKNQDPETLRIMGLLELNASTAQTWLEDRVQYIVDENLDLRNSLYLAQGSYSYENSTEFPVIEEAPDHPSSGTGTKVYTVMSNIGAGVYLAMKSQRMLVGFDIDGLGKFELTSPRVGVIQIGEGLFLPLRRKEGIQENDTPGNTMHRLAVFFHEARHSDGHGKSLAFAHALCPKGHDFEDYNACDRNLNGPYTVGALMTRQLLEACDTCSIEDKEALKLEVADSFSRVLKLTPFSKSDIDGQIMLTETKLMICQVEARYSMRNELECKAIEAELEQMRKNRENPSADAGIPSVDWDARPEGRR